MMTLEEIRAALGWCTILNMAFLLFWVVFYAFGRSFIYRMHGRFFDIPEKSMNVIHYSGMAFYKLLIFIFNLIPYLALRIVGS